MEIFSNGVFWIILATIIFILALIGFLTESMKKSKKNNNNEKNDNISNSSVEAVQPTDSVIDTSEVNVNFNAMPDVNKPLEEVKVDTLNENVSTLNDEVSADSNVETLMQETSDNSEKAVEQQDSSNILNTPENGFTDSSNNNVSTLDNTNSGDKNNDIWNL